MQQVIDGKRYNTETATLLGSGRYNGNCTDFQYWQESLYVTAKGNYFGAGSGGPMSRYSTAVGNNGRGGGSNIRTMTKQSAMEWAEAYDQDALEHFADMVSDA